MNIKEKDIQKCSTKFDYELNAIIIGMFGFVGRYKGHDIALNVLASLPKNYKLLIVGGQHPEDRSEYFNYLLEQIEELGVVDRVQITGWVSQEEAEAFLGRTKICIAPYREVGLSGSGALTWLLKSNRWIVVSKIDAFLPLLRTMPGIASTAEGSTNALKWAIETLAAKEFESSPVKKQIEDYVNSNSWNNHAKSLRCTYLNLLGVYDVSHLQPKQ